MPEYQVIVKVIEIRGKCPFYKVGDKLIINRQEVPIDQITPKKLCLHSICGLYGTIMQVRGGIAEKIYAQCLDPGPSYNKDGGTVIFEVKRGKKL